MSGQRPQIHSSKTQGRDENAWLTWKLERWRSDPRGTGTWGRNQCLAGAQEEPGRSVGRVPQLVGPLPAGWAAAEWVALWQAVSPAVVSRKSCGHQTPSTREKQERSRHAGFFFFSSPKGTPCPRFGLLNDCPGSQGIGLKSSLIQLLFLPLSLEYNPTLWWSHYKNLLGLPWWSSGKDCAHKAGGPGLIPGRGKKHPHAATKTRHSQIN